jgi:hypothetical protein
MYNSIDNISHELTRIRKLMERMLSKLEAADAEPEAEDLDVRGPQ